MIDFRSNIQTANNSNLSLKDPDVLSRRSHLPVVSEKNNHREATIIKVGVTENTRRKRAKRYPAPTPGESH